MAARVEVTAGVLALLLLSVPGAAQAPNGSGAPPTQAAPTVHPAAPAKRAKSAAVKPSSKPDGSAKPGKAATAPPPWMAADPDRATRSDGAAPARGSVVSHARPVDPVEIGGKWNGSNSSAAQTRSENYGGTAAGTGGEVGFKLHF